MPATSKPLLIGNSGQRGNGNNRRFDVDLNDAEGRTDRRNFNLNNDANGLAKSTAYLEGQSAQDASRTAPQMGQNLSGVQAQGLGQVAQSSRGQQDMLAEALRGQAYGVGPNPALAQLNASTQQAQANQRSVAAGSMGYDGAAAQREAAWGNSQLGAQGEQQGRVMQAQQMAFGRDQYAGLTDALRGQDLATRDALQGNGIRQAGLDDAAHTQNDAMTSFYLAEQDKLRRAQAGANMGFEAQDAATKLGQSNAELSRSAYAQQVDAKTQAAAASGAAGFITTAGKMSSDSADADKRQKRNPYDPGDY